MKKLACLLLALVMALSLVACSKPADDTATPDDTPDETPVEAKVMKIAGTMSQAETDGEYNGTKVFAEKVEELTGGSIKVEIYPSSQLGGQTEFSEGVMMGSIEACVLGPSYFGVIDPFMYFLEMPFLFEDLDHARALFETENDAKAEIDSHLEAMGLMQVGTLYRSPRIWCNTVRPMKTIADSDGVKMRTPESPISTATVTAMGANPVTVAWSEVYTGLESGLTNGVENAITEIYNNNMHEVVDYCTETNHMLNSQGILVSKKWFDGLSADEQAAILEAGKAATAWRAEQLGGEVDNAWKAFEDKGIEIVRQGEFDTAPFVEACQIVYEQYLNDGAFTQEFIDSIRALAK